MPAKNVLLISNFNTSTLEGYLERDEAEPQMDVASAPYGQAIQALKDPTMDCWNNTYDLAVVWVQPDYVAGSFARILDCESATPEQVLQEVDTFSLLISGLHNRVNVILVPNWVVPRYSRMDGVLDLSSPTSPQNILARMNLRLVKNLQHSAHVYLLDSQRWTTEPKGEEHSAKLWYLAKIPFPRHVFQRAASDIKLAYRAITGAGRKVIILDLDNTLWGGIVGDDGCEGLVLGGHNHIGEAYVDFQKALKSLRRRGILLAIASKNDEALAMEAVRSHPEMVLHEHDFASIKINWNDKATNIVSILTELNLGPESAVFIDDSLFERSRVRSALPDVLVPEWPDNPLLYRESLLAMDCFEALVVTNEDRDRTGMYLAEKRRKASQHDAGSLQDWLKTLQLCVSVQPVNASNIKRVVQLLNKTNQMNLRTRRMSESELLNWSSEANRRIWTFRVRDRFGDYGLCGILSVEIAAYAATITDFVLSCRVLGRKVEDTMLWVAINAVANSGVKSIFAEYVPTPKNIPCLDFLHRSGLAVQAGSHTFLWNTDRDYPRAEHVNVDIQTSA